MIKVFIPKDSGFNYKQCKKLYKKYRKQIGDDQEFRDIVKNTFFYSFFDEESEIPDGQAETGAVSRSFPQAEAGADTEIASSQTCYLPDYAGCRKSVVLRLQTSFAIAHSTANPAPRKDGVGSFPQSPGSEKIERKGTTSRKRKSSSVKEFQGKHIGCIYYYEKEGKLFVNAFANRHTHEINIKCLKMSFDWFNCDIYAKSHQKTAIYCLYKCGFKKINEDTYKLERG